MYYFISWIIHAVFILTVMALAVILLRYYRLKPRITKTQKPEIKESSEPVADIYEDEAVDPTTLYTMRDE